MPNQIVPQPAGLAALANPTLTTAERARLLGATPAIFGTKHLSKDLDLDYSISFDRSQIVVRARIRGVVVWEATLDEAHPEARFQGHHGVIKEDLVLRANLRTGEILANGTIAPFNPKTNAFGLESFTSELLDSFSPSLGEVGDQTLAHAPSVNDPEIGASMSIVPTITRIPVDAKKRLGTPVGGIVKERLFPDLPDFVFNVCFAVGPFGLFQPGVYGKPTSPWFNVFLGYYQIDAPKTHWQRPFGYRIENGSANIAFDEILKLGKADWNYFSNWMYGVPRAVVAKYDAPDAGVQKRHDGRVAIGARSFDLIDLDGFTAVSAYQSSAPNAKQLRDNVPILTQLWRHTYGEPQSVSGFKTSFVPTKMHARFYMTYFEDAGAYHTCLFGGTVNKEFDGALNDRFIDEQLEACKLVLTSRYPTLGFPP